MEEFQPLLFLLLLGVVVLLVIGVYIKRWNQKNEAIVDQAQQDFIARADEFDLHNRQFHPPVLMNGWMDFKEFKVVKKEVETWTEFKGKKISDICSFYLSPVETPKPLPTFLPGQHLRFSIPNLGDGVDERFYSLSDSPNPDYYRVSIKRALPHPSAGPDVPQGLGSSYFHDQLHQDSSIQVAQPAGEFYLDPDIKRNGYAVLLAGGIGLTPMVSMSKYLIDIGYKDKIMLFYGVRHIPEVALLKDLAAVAKSGVSVNICLSSPVEEVPQDIVDMSINLLTGTDEKGFPIINHPGPGIRVSADLLRAMITEPDESDYYLCGPPPMMKSLVDGLYFWGMPQERVHWEGFGPCAVTWPADIINSPLKPCGLTVVDLKNNDKAFLDWSASKGTLLTLLDQNKGKVRAVKRQCGQGACGQCKLTCRGKVVYDRKPTYKGLQPNECLTCCGRPDGDLLLFLNS